MKKLLPVCVLAAVLALGLWGCSGVGSNSVYITEVVTSNSASLVDPDYGSPDFIELHNTASYPVNLKGYGITKAKKNGMQYVFGDVTIPAGGYAVVYCCDELEGVPGLATSYNLSKEGVTLLLTTPQSAVLQQVDVPALATDVAYGLGEEGQWGYLAAPTPGQANGRAVDSVEALSTLQERGVTITEVLPYGEGAFIELYNQGLAANLSRYYLTDNPTNRDKYRLPEVVIEKNAYYAVYVADLPFNLGSDEEAVYLCDQWGVAAGLTWEAALFEGMSAGLENGQSVYYFDPTPGAVNSGPTTAGGFELAQGKSQVLLNEVLIQNKYSLADSYGDRSPWCELYNTGPDVSLKGYFLSDREDNPFKWPLPDVTLSQGGYLIVFLSGKDVQGEQLHAPFTLGDRDGCLTLTNRYEKTVQTYTITARVDNVSMGLDQEGAQVYFSSPTPAAANTAVAYSTVEEAAKGPVLRINEVSAVSAARSGKEDWIELYNPGEALSLEGWHLSDSSSDLSRWPLSGSVDPGGYRLVQSYGSDDGSKALSVAVSGERVFLSDPSGVVRDVFTCPVLRPGLSAGIGREGDRAIYTQPTPGDENTGATVVGYCAAPLFSAPGGFVQGPFDLVLSTATPGAQIRYTLDGSSPTENSPLYAGPISITKNTPVKAAAFCAGLLRSDYAAATYLFGQGHQLPVVCLSISESDKSYIFGSQSRLDYREREGYVEYYDQNRLGVAFPAGLRITGNSTRVYAQKSFNISLKGAYGQSSVTYPFFPELDITEFSSLALRNSGQDNGRSRIRDAFFSNLARGLNVDYMETTFVVVYLNGKYWGLYELKENQNPEYYQSHYGVEGESVNLVRSSQYTYQGPTKDILNVYAYAESHNMSDQANFDKYLEKMDSDYFIDYIIVQCFAANSDPYNRKYAATSDYALKWRPMHYDLDLCSSGNNPKARVMGSFFTSQGIEIGLADENGERARVRTSLFYAFYQNKDWCERFIERYAYVLNHQLTTQNVLELYDELVDMVRSEMPATIDRWGYPRSMSEWEREVKALRECMEKRREYAMAELKAFFNLSEERMGQLFPQG